VREAYEAIAEAVTEKAGPEHFQGVTVQPMIDRDQGYELIIGSSVDAQFGPVILFGTGGNWWKCLKIGRSLCLPSIPPWPAA
jgi:acetyltransferase